jgi:hypothetical protein
VPGRSAALATLTGACAFREAWLSVRLIEAAFESAARDGAWIAC